MTTDADRINDDLRRGHPAAYRCLSPLGRRAVFPRGIPFQAAEARGARIDATIGQLTDGHGTPLPLPALVEAICGLDPAETFLYAPVEGPKPLRDAWLAHQRAVAGGATLAVGQPFTTHGLTHGLSLVATLFTDPDTHVILPDPAWENYELVFQLHAGARMGRYETHRDGRFTEDGLAQALAAVPDDAKALVVLNFPSNPTGWWPSASEARRLVDVISAHPGPLVVLCDDAYQGWIYEPDLQPRSLFWDLAERADPERQLVVKCDGATKELAFFASRVGFLTTTATGAAEAALLSKLKYVVRGSVGPPSGPAMAMTLAALRDPATPGAFAERVEIMASRYRVMRRELGRLDPRRVSPRPFNASYFVLLQLDASLEAEDVRQRLLREHSVGTIAFPELNALRLAYCSIHEDRLPALVDALAAVLG